MLTRPDAATLTVPRTRRYRSQHCGPVLCPAVSSVLSHLFRLLISRLGLLLVSGDKRDAEIVALRHQILVLQRQNERPKFTPTDRTILAVLSRAFEPRRLDGVMLIVKPATVIAWHRRLIARHWTQSPQPEPADQPPRLLSEQLLGIGASSMRTGLVVDALAMAAGVRGGRTTGIIFHGDRGAQYLAGDYRQAVADRHMIQSAGRTGVCWDNSVAEAFFSSLKRELVHRYRFEDRAGARRAIFAWINRYNTRRLHSSLRYRSPIDWENTQPQAAQAA